MLVLKNEQLRRLEDDFTAKGNDHIKLMEKAGDSISRFVFDELDGISNKAIAVVCGKGNNGGDGYWASRMFLENKAKVRVLMVDGEPTTPDAIDMFSRAELYGVKTIDCNAEDADMEVIERYILDADVVIDAIYGIGFHGELPEHIAKITKIMNLAEGKVIAVDIPSGVESETGRAAENCVNADYTVTFTAMKPAHLIYPAAEYCGEVSVADIGIELDEKELLKESIQVVDYQSVRLCFMPRKPNTHKGDYGKLYTLVGSKGMAGAAAFAGKAAVHSGAGLVRMAVPESIYNIVAQQVPEAVYDVCEESERGRLKDEDFDYFLSEINNSNACLAGCGMGNDKETRSIVEKLIRNSEVPLVLDADALNAVSREPDMLKEARCPVVLTPHPGEMARIMNKKTAEVQEDRIGSALSVAQEYGVWVVLKGARTIVATPDGTVFINLGGNPGMSKAGSGDVLAGIISALCAQGMKIEEACCCGVYIHAEAGDRAAGAYSQHAMGPMDIIYELSSVFSDIER